MRERGLSLIEFLVYFAILVVVLTITLQLAAGMLRVQARQRSVTEVNQNLRFATGRFSQAVHDEDTASITVDGVSGELQLKDSGSSPTYYIKLNSSSDAEGTFGQIQICEGADCDADDYSDLTNSKVDVISLTFTKYTNTNASDSVRLELTIKYRNANLGELRYYEISSQVTAGLR